MPSLPALTQSQKTTMPNYVMNIVRINADEGRIKVIQEFMASRDTRMDSDDGPLTFDFNRLIPMPEEIAGTESQNPDERPQEERKRLFRLYGADNRYDWAWENWGTKWNAYEDVLTPDGFAFQTAWAAPVPVFIALSERFPGVAFTVTYADDDIGYNCGVMHCHGGQVIDSGMDGDKAFARHVWGDTMDEASDTRAAA